VSHLVAISSALIASTLLAIASHCARESRLATLAIHPQFAHLPELARKRARLVGDRKRRALAAGRRRTAAATQPAARFDCCPILRERVATVRPELLEIAAALEHGHDPDPTCIALVHELLTDARSPLYNDNIPAADLHTTLKRASAGLAAQSHT
jgi:hypothetical protein